MLLGLTGIADWVPVISSLLEPYFLTPRLSGRESQTGLVFKN
jgi:hypothetical protein